MATEGDLNHVQDSTNRSISVQLRFRSVAWAFSIAFFVTMAAAGFATFTVTDYSPDTDKIQAFYGVFNPCIWFDHYPAKVIAAVGISVTLLFGFGYDILILLHAYTCNGLFDLFYTAAIISASIFIDACFVNVFTTNLYPETNPHRRLHGVHMHDEAVSFDEEMLSSADVKIILLHTSFYIAWIISNFILASQVVPRALKMRKERLSLRWTIALGFGGLGLFLHVASMLMIVMRGKASVELSEINDTVQRLLLTIHDFLFAAWWGWLPVFYFRFVIPSTEGVMISFQLAPLHNQSSAICSGGVCPEKVVAGSLRWIALILLSGCLFYSGWEHDDTTWLNISSVLRFQPYAYFAGPLWLLTTVGFGIGIALTLVRLRLQEESWSHYAILLGILLFLAMFLSILIIIQQERFTWIFLLVFMLTMLFWILRLNVATWRRNRCTPFAYAFGFICLVVGSSMYWFLAFPMLLWLCLYDLAVPSGAKIFVKVATLQESGIQEPKHNHVTLPL